MNPGSWTQSDTLEGFKLLHGLSVGCEVYRFEALIGPGGRARFSTLVGQGQDKVYSGLGETNAQRAMNELLGHMSGGAVNEKELKTAGDSIVGFLYDYGFTEFRISFGPVNSGKISGFASRGGASFGVDILFSDGRWANFDDALTEMFKILDGGPNHHLSSSLV